MSRSIELLHDEVVGILAGTISRLARPVEPAFNPDWGDKVTVLSPSESPLFGRGDEWSFWFANKGNWDTKIRCPFGAVGEVLWGTEEWYQHPEDKNSMYRADYKSTTQLMQKALDFSWRPASEMPQWVSRISFAVKYVDAKTAKDVTDEEIKACGFVNDPEVLACRKEGTILSAFGIRECFYWHMGKYDDGEKIWVFLAEIERKESK